MNFLPLLFALAFCQADELPPVCDIEPVVSESVDMISVAHFGGDSQIAFYWSLVQGDWMLLDHRWIDHKYCVLLHGERWCMQWHDQGDHCYRVVYTDCWVESWEEENPMAEQQGIAWFRQLLTPGLKQPPKVEVEEAR